MFRTDNSSRKFLEIISKGNVFSGVGGKQREYLRVLMPDDVCLMDTTTTDYNGRVCLVKSPSDGGMHYQRLFIEGDTVSICDPTDGEENDRCKLNDLVCDGIVTAIVRELPAEDKIDLSPLEKVDAAINEARKDRVCNYYSFDWSYAVAIKKKFKGNGLDCFVHGYWYGFMQGRRAEKNGKRRKRRAEQKKA